MLFRSDRKSTRLNSSHTLISYAVFCLKKKKKKKRQTHQNSVHRERVGRECTASPYTCLCLYPSIFARFFIRTFSIIVCSFFFLLYGDHRDLHSFPTRRSSDLPARRRSPVDVVPVDYVADAVHALAAAPRSEEHTSELQSHSHLVCRLLFEKKKHSAVSHRPVNTTPDTTDSHT